MNSPPRSKIETTESTQVTKAYIYSIATAYISATIPMRSIHRSTLPAMLDMPSTSGWNWHGLKSPSNSANATLKMSR